MLTLASTSLPQGVRVILDSSRAVYPRAENQVDKRRLSGTEELRNSCAFRRTTRRPALHWCVLFSLFLLLFTRPIQL